MNMYSAFKSKIGETIVQFDDITRFAGEMWLSDGCVFVAALKVADSWIHKQDHGRMNQVHVVDSVYLDFQDVKDRERMLDTSQCVLSKAVDSHIVLVPVRITVDIQHWCAAIVGFGSKIIWIYDPKTRDDYLDAIDTIVMEKLVPVVDKTCKLTIRRSSAWHQTDGHNCGVLIIKWFETYLNVTSNTKLDEDLKDLTPQLISDKDLDECRYQMFQSVFSDVATS
ncbi:hypothetical protein PI124_g5318 [Phytophthora idaei]|nr:hypothetical protein PI125_g4770 [Phytophthora idaei]KAG3172953.1 hypothetical protein PI126_g1097 [Phytophthora idaei]KAG3250056.1 hypothetical protein PI124_g5318 [Phytophthora idaei]